MLRPRSPNNNIIKSSTPHLFMWICDGKKLARENKLKPDALPLPQGGKFNYYDTLKAECINLQSSMTPVYLVYMGSLLEEGQKYAINKLAIEQGMENLYLIDYDEIKNSIRDSEDLSKKNITSTIHDYVQSFQKYNLNKVGKGGIADVVDMTRLVLLANCDILKQAALEKYSSQDYPYKSNILRNSAPGVIYRDFDVRLHSELHDINLPHEADGFICSTNYVEKMKEAQYIALKENPNLKNEIENFFNKYIWDMDGYLAMRLFWVNKKLKRPKAYQEFIQSAKNIGVDEFRMFACIFLENSLLGINRPQHPIITDALRRTFLGKDTPYAAIQQTVRKKIINDPCAIALGYGEKIFKVGNDLTWQAGRDEVSYNNVSCLINYKTLSSAEWKEEKKLERKPVSIVNKEQKKPAPAQSEHKFHDEKFNIQSSSGSLEVPHGTDLRNLPNLRIEFEKACLEQPYNFGIDKSYFSGNMSNQRGLTLQDLKLICLSTQKEFLKRFDEFDNGNKKGMKLIIFLKISLMDSKGNCNNFYDIESFQNFLQNKYSIVLPPLNELPKEQAIDGIDVETVKKTHSKISKITAQYIKNHRAPGNEMLDHKKKVFKKLADALSNLNETKYKRLENFVKILQDEDKNILNQHRTASWKRYISNVLSFLTILPAIYRALHSYYKYSTAQFWKPESEKVKELAINECTKLKRNIG